MTIYSWGQNNPNSPVQKLEVVPYAKREMEAVIYAAPNAPQGSLVEIPEMLRSIGMTVIPDVKDDQYVLRVRGFGKNEAMIPEALEQNGFVAAEARQQEKSPKKKRGNPIEVIKEKSLKGAGLVYFVGDAALMIAGMKHKDKNELQTGAAFTLGSIGLARYAEKKPDKAFNELYEDMLVEFSKEGVEVPDLDRVTTKDLGKPGGIIERIEEFLYNHPSEIFTSMNAYAGFQLIAAGRNQDNVAKSAAGALIATGMLTALLVPEKKKEGPELGPDGKPLIDGDGEHAWVKPEEEEKGGIFSPVKKFADWVQEKPLRVGGYLAIANNIAQAYSAKIEKDRYDSAIRDLPVERDRLTAERDDWNNYIADRGKTQDQITWATDERDKVSEQISSVSEKYDHAVEHQGDWVYNLAAGASYFVANSLLSISSKDNSHGGHGGGGNGGANPIADVAAASAAMLAHQPEEVREAMMQKIAVAISERKEVTQSPDDLLEMMREKVAQAKISPWVARVAEQQAAATQQDPSVTR